MHATSTRSEDQSTTQGKARTIDLASLTFYSGPLVPLSGDLWPTFDVVEAFAYGSDPHLAPTIVAKSLAPADNTTSAKLQTPPPQKSPRRAQPPNPQSSSTTRKNSLKSSNASPRNKRIPRPRNAFIIYRSTVWAQRKIPIGIERDHRHISRIIGHCWNSLPEEEKRTWKVRAEEEKREHLRKYPGYRYSPNTRTKKPVKRKVNRNGEKDKQRCKKVAELLLLGAEGSALENAVKELDVGNEGHSSIPAPSPTPSQSPITPLFSSRPLYHGEVQGTPKFLPEKNRSHEFPTFSLSMLTPPEGITPLPITPTSSGDSSQYQFPMLQYNQPYPGVPVYLACPETNLMSLDGSQGLYGPLTSWGDYSSGVYTQINDPYYVE